MTLHPTELRSRLQAAIDAAGVDATELARRIGRSPEYVRDFLNGRKNSLKANELVLVEVELKTEPGYLTGYDVNLLSEALKPILRGFRGAPPINAPPVRPAHLSQDEISARYGDRMPILSAREDNEGHISIDHSPVEIVARPWFFKEVQECFAFIIPVYDYDPVFQIGDLAFINPKLPLIRNRNTLIGIKREDGTLSARLVELVSWNREIWTVRQLGDPHEQVVERSKWPLAFRIVGRLEG